MIMKVQRLFSLMICTQSVNPEVVILLKPKNPGNLLSLRISGFYLNKDEPIKAVGSSFIFANHPSSTLRE